MKHYLILSNRLLFFFILLFILFVLSRPVESAGVIGDVVIDNSVSMTLNNDFNSSELINNPKAELSERFIYDENSKATFIKSHPIRSNVFETLISDFQNYSKLDIEQLIMDTTRRKNLVVVGDINSYSNVYIDSVSLNFNTQDFSQQRLNLALRTSDALTSGSLIVKLFKDDRQLSSIVKEVTELNEVSFDLPIDLSGKFRVELAGDDVFYDNEFFYVIEKRRKPIISLIDMADNLYLREVFANSNLFELNNLDYKSIDFEMIDRSDLIVLNSVESLISGIELRIKDKSLIVCPSSSASPSSFNELFGVNLLRKSSTERFQIDFDYEHPLLAGVYDKKSNVNVQPKTLPLYSVSGGYESIIKLRGGDEFFVKSLSENYYLFNSILDIENTDLVTDALFLPLFYQIALGAVNHDHQLYYYPGDLVVIEVSNSEIPPVLVSNDIELIPDFNPVGSSVSFRLPTDLRKGFYTIMHSGDTIKQIAVNISKEESVMKGLTRQELEDEFGNLSHVQVQSMVEFQEEKTGDAQSSIWKYALILSVLLLITETMLHRYLR